MRHQFGETLNGEGMPKGVPALDIYARFFQLPATMQQQYDPKKSDGFFSADAVAAGSLVHIVEDAYGANVPGNFVRKNGSPVQFRCFSFRYLADQCNGEKVRHVVKFVEFPSKLHDDLAGENTDQFRFDYTIDGYHRSYDALPGRYAYSVIVQRDPREEFVRGHVAQQVFSLEDAEKIIAKGKDFVAELFQATGAHVSTLLQQAGVQQEQDNRRFRSRGGARDWKMP